MTIKYADVRDLSRYRPVADARSIAPTDAERQALDALRPARPSLPALVPEGFVRVRGALGTCNVPTERLNPPAAPGPAELRERVRRASTQVELDAIQRKVMGR